ncbi:MAG: hypothetical protein ACI959_001612 [Limisphaerales bacterium]|jgi:uncharacterized protein YprB with RNaseH-like and TPR domain
MRVLDQAKIEDLLFFDIETAPVAGSFEELSPELQAIWMAKEDKKRPEEVTNPADWFFDRAGISAEFGRVVCIAIGYFNRGQDGLKLRIKTIAEPDEAILLQDFQQLLDRFTASKDNFRLCGHNIKEFDIPWLCRRMLINNVPIPSLLDVSGLKPWEIVHLDTLELWRFGERRNFTSLRLMAEILGVPTPKDDIDGSEVGRVFWEEMDLDRICTYCAKDVKAVADLVLRLKGQKVLEEDQVMLV